MEVLKELNHNEKDKRDRDYQKLTVYLESYIYILVISSLIILYLISKSYSEIIEV